MDDLHSVEDDCRLVGGLDSVEDELSSVDEQYLVDLLAAFLLLVVDFLE